MVTKFALEHRQHILLVRFCGWQYIFLKSPRVKPDTVGAANQRKHFTALP